MLDHDSLPLVSIIITSFNRANMISRAIDSALAQSYKHLEILIIDNNSTDHSDAIIRDYAIHHTTITYIKNDTNIGFVASLFKAIYLAKGEFFTHISSDDYLVYEGFIQTAVEKSKSVVHPVIICARVLYFIESTGNFSPDGSYKVYEHTFYKQPYVEGEKVFYEYTKIFPITMAACLINRKVFTELLIKKVAPIHSDIEIILQILIYGNVIFMDVEAYVVVVHENNYSIALQPAKISIDNFTYIENPYIRAKETNKLHNGDKLDRWKENMLFAYSIQKLESYYRCEKKEYQIFKKYLRKTYPSTYKKITHTPRWILIYVVFKYKKLGNIAIKARAFFIQLTKGT